MPHMPQPYFEEKKVIGDPSHPILWHMLAALEAVESNYKRRLKDMGYDIPEDHHGPLPRVLVSEDTQKAKATPPADLIMQLLQDSSGLLTRAYSIGVEHNPMAADLPVFQDMQATAGKLKEIMLKVSKTRGLR